MRAATFRSWARRRTWRCCAGSTSGGATRCRWRRCARRSRRPATRTCARTSSRATCCSASPRLPRPLEDDDRGRARAPPRLPRGRRRALARPAARRRRRRARRLRRRPRHVLLRRPVPEGAADRQAGDGRRRAARGRRPGVAGTRRRVLRPARCAAHEEQAEQGRVHARVQADDDPQLDDDDEAARPARRRADRAPPVRAGRRPPLPSPAMQFDTIEVSVDGARGDLVLNRPEKLNPLSSHTLGEIEAAARWFDGFDELKVVVVSGRGRAFSAGADVSSFGGGDGAAAAARRATTATAGGGWRGRWTRCAPSRWPRCTAGASAAGSCWPACATCASPPARRASRSPRSSSASRWRGAASRASCARSARR